jgi:hypothetical protein
MVKVVFISPKRRREEEEVSHLILCDILLSLIFKGKVDFIQVWLRD